MYPLLATFRLSRAGGLAARPGACRRIIGLRQNRRKQESLDDDGSVAMTEHAVVIAGGGPTGLMLAGELALAGVDVAIVERRASQDLAGSRAGGLHSRTIEVLDQRGIADRFLSQGQVAQVAGFAVIRLDISDFPTRHNYGLALWQNHIERILAGWVGELPVPIYRGREVTGFAQDDTGVDVELSDGQSLRAAVSRRVRRRTQPDPQSRRHRVPRVGSDHQPPDRRGRAGRGAGMGHPPRRLRDPCLEQVERIREARWLQGGPVRVMVTEQHLGADDRTHPARSQRGAHRRIRDRLRDPQSHLDLQVHRHDAAGRGLPRPTGPAGRRRRARAFPGRWTGPQHRGAGCGEPGMEAGPGGQPDIAGKPPGYLPCRAPPGRCPRAAQHDGASRALPHRRPHQGPARHRVRAPRHGRAAQTIRRG